MTDQSPAKSMPPLTAAALVLGVIALLTALLPMGPVLPFLTGAAGVLCGAIAYTRAKQESAATPWLPVVGIGLSAVGFLLEAVSFASA